MGQVRRASARTQSRRHERVSAAREAKRAAIRCSVRRVTGVAPSPGAGGPRTFAGSVPRVGAGPLPDARGLPRGVGARKWAKPVRVCWLFHVCGPVPVK